MKKCTFCCNDFEPNHGKQKFCSGKCRVASLRAKTGANHPEKIIHDILEPQNMNQNEINGPKIEDLALGNGLSTAAEEMPKNSLKIANEKRPEININIPTSIIGKSRYAQYGRLVPMCKTKEDLLALYLACEADDLLIKKDELLNRINTRKKILKFS